MKFKNIIFIFLLMAASLCSAQVPTWTIGLQSAFDVYRYPVSYTKSYALVDDYWFDNGKGFSIGLSNAVKIHEKWQSIQHLSLANRYLYVSSFRSSRSALQQQYVNMGTGFRYFAMSRPKLLLSAEASFNFSALSIWKEEGGDKYGRALLGSDEDQLSVPISVGLHIKTGTAWYLVLKPYYSVLTRHRSKTPDYRRPQWFGLAIELNHSGKFCSCQNEQKKQ